MLKNKINNLILYAIIFLIGFLSATFLLLVFNNYFSISKSASIQLDPINAISILVNIILIIYATRFLSRKNEEDRVEKDVLINYLKNFQHDLEDSLDKFFLAERLNFNDVVAKLKTLRQTINSVTGLIKKYNYNSIIDNTDICILIDSCIRNINDNFTNTIKSEDDNVTIDKNEISIGTKNRQDIEDSNLKIREMIFDLIVLINRKL